MNLNEYEYVCIVTIVVKLEGGGCVWLLMNQHWYDMIIKRTKWKAGKDKSQTWIYVHLIQWLVPSE